MFKNGTKKSGLCKEGCSNINRLFCSHSKLQQGQGGGRDRTNLANMHVTQEPEAVVPPEVNDQPQEQQDLEPLNSTNLAQLSMGSLWTLSASPAPLHNEFDPTITTPLSHINS